VNNSSFGQIFKMKKSLYIIGLCFAFYSCGSNSEESEGVVDQDSAALTEELILPELQVEIIQQGEGDKPNPGDMVKVHYTGMLKSTGEKFDSSVDRGEPIEFQLGSGRVIPGWEQGIAQLNKGTKARLIIPAHLGYGDREVGAIPANSDLVFEVELVDFSPAPKPWNIEGAEIVETNTGLKYAVLTKGKGKKAEAGKTVQVHYSGYFAENGFQFDSSVSRGEPLEFPLGQGKVIPGWDEGISYLTVGSKAQLMIPYHLAYGEQGYPGAIPPKADLIFDVELVGVK